MEINSSSSGLSLEHHSTHSSHSSSDSFTFDSTYSDFLSKKVVLTDHPFIFNHTHLNLQSHNLASQYFTQLFLHFFKKKSENSLDHLNFPSTEGFPLYDTSALTLNCSFITPLTEISELFSFMRSFSLNQIAFYYFVINHYFRSKKMSSLDTTFNGFNNAFSLNLNYSNNHLIITFIIYDTDLLSEFNLIVDDFRSQLSRVLSSLTFELIIITH